MERSEVGLERIPTAFSIYAIEIDVSKETSLYFGELHAIDTQAAGSGLETVVGHWAGAVQAQP